MKTTVRILDTLVEFLDARKQAHQEYMQDRGYSWDEPVTMKIGQRYAKLVTGTTVTAFVDLLTGNIYKPAGWTKPANHVRGNIFDNLGTGAFDQNGHVRYLK